jgi:hypothetical protein
VRALEERGYLVKIIDDLAKARETLKSQWWHLAVVDIRLIDERSHADFSGLDLVTQETDPVICKLILTAYPSADAAVKALRAYPGELPPAVDFVSKLDPYDVVVERIVTAVEQHTGINWDLETVFDGPTTYLCMADWLHRNAPEGVTLAQTVSESADELADLWAKLFSTQKRIAVFPSPQGRGNAIISRVKPHSNGAETLVIVKSGWRPEIEREEQSYDQFVAPFAGPASTQKLDVQRTLHFAAIAYSLVGGHVEETERFTDFYQEEKLEGVTDALRHIFGQVCAPWYALPMQESTMPMDKACRLRMGLESTRKRKRLAKRLEELADNATALGFSARRRGSNIHFELDGDLKLDLEMLEKWIYEITKVIQDKSVLKSFPESPTHGDLNGNNVLVDRDGRTWLIDFDKTGYGYRLRDFAELESVIALDLRRHTSLHALLRFEELLCSQSFWTDGLELPNDLETQLGDEGLCKALRAIQELRWLARQWEEDEGDLRRYYLSLFFEAILRIVTDGRDSPAQPSPIWRRLHALTRAAMIIKTLSA